MIFNKVTVYGGGLIGTGWAVSFLIKGVDVTMYDLSDELLADSRDRIEKMLDFFAEPGIDVLTKAQRDSSAANLTYTSDVETAAANAEFIQENGPENLSVKRSIIQTIERYNSTAIIASSTSGLLISDIAAEARHPERIICGHPYNPVQLIPLVELAKGEHTANEAIEKAYRFYKEIGKEPVVLQKECKGFICNRIQNALNREAEDLVYRGVCTVEDVDKAVTFGPGLRWGLMGPHMVIELGSGKTGIKDFMLRMSKSSETYKDMASWTRVPEDYFDMAEQGAMLELSNRSEKEGRDHAGLERFRDEGLVNLLKFHGKF
jgi:3-hydroxyacyl-CoA dehydrogenase